MVLFVIAEQHRLELVPNLQVLQCGNRLAVLPLVDGSSRDSERVSQSQGVAIQGKGLLFGKGLIGHGSV